MIRAGTGTSFAIGIGKLTPHQFPMVMEAHEYLEKYVRSVPGGALAWERSIFSRSGQWDASELIDAAVDIVWESFGGEAALERAAVEVRRNGNFIVFAPLSVPNGDFLRMAA